MLKIDLNIFPNKEDYNEFVKFLNKLYCYYQDKYQFLGFGRDVWSKIFMDTINGNILSSDVSLIANKSRIKVHIDNYLAEGIKKEAKGRNVRLLNNILVLIRKTETNDIQIMLMFLAKLKELKIELDKEYFEAFLNSSQTFKNLVLGLSKKDMPLNDLYTFIYYLEFYSALKPYNMDLSSTKKLSDYYVKILGLPLRYLCKLNTSEFKHLKILISKQDYLDYLKRLIKELDSSVQPEEVDKVVCYYTLGELKKLFEDCYNYMYARYTKDNSFILKIYQKIKENRIVVKDEREKKAPSKKRKEKPLYDRFPDIEGATNDDKKELIDYLITLLSKKDNELIQNVIKGIKIDEKERERIIAKLKRWYKSYLKTGRALNYNTKPLYNRFPDIEGMEQENKIKIINFLVSELSKEEQEILSNEYLSRINGSARINVIIGKLNRWYDNYLKTGKTKLTSRKQLIDRLPDIEGVSNERKLEALNKVLLLLDDEKRVVLNAYLEGDVLDSEDMKKVASAFERVKHLYLKYINNEPLTGVRKTLDERFVDIEGIDRAQKIELIHILFRLKLKIDEQLIVQNYLNGLYKRNSLEAKNAFKYMTRLKMCYIREMLSSKDKYILLLHNLRLTEYRYRTLGYTKEEYLIYKNRIIAEIIETNPKITLQRLLEEYISIAVNELQKDVLVSIF